MTKVRNDPKKLIEYKKRKNMNMKAYTNRMKAKQKAKQSLQQRRSKDSLK